MPIVQEGTVFVLSLKILWDSLGFKIAVNVNVCESHFL